MGTERCDQIIAFIDQALAGPNMTRRDGRFCWYCQQIEHNEGPSGLCEPCLTKLRDPELSIEMPETISRTDNERPAILEGAYQHRPAVVATGMTGRTVTREDERRAIEQAIRRELEARARELGRQ